jgi:hypothetical protein
MRIQKMIVTVEPNESGSIEGSHGGVFQPRQVEVTRLSDGLDVLITGPRAKKGGGLHATANGRWWGINDEITPGWPPLAISVCEMFGRAVEAFEGGAPDA